MHYTEAMQSLLILGRQPALGMAELESVYGAKSVSWFSNQAAVVDKEPDLVDFKRLGGSTKLAKILTILPATNWKKIEKYLLDQSPHHAQFLPEGKMHLGLSAYGVQVSTGQLEATGLKLKKAIRNASGKSVRLVPNKELTLGSAQIIHHHLTGANGWELVLISNGEQTILAQTVDEQDIESYTLRDRGRPKRDARVGMLPPKLAQIIINLATTGQHQTVLDPFCGTGVVLIEAALMGHNVYGTDIEQRMIDYSQRNLEWLNQTFNLSPTEATLEPGDATHHTWQSAPVTAVACEAYLGRPLAKIPDSETLNSIRHTCDQIIGGFLRNIAQQVPSGTRLCVAVPAWNTQSGFRHLKTLDSIADLGYNFVRFEHVRSDELLYYRPDQVVARELLVLERS